MTTDYTIGITPPTLATAEGGSRDVLERANRAVGFVPNMYKGMAVIPGLLDTYLDGYARFREDAGFAPPEQEIVFLAISRFNGCDYCTAAHSMLAEKKSDVPANVLAALRAGDPLPEPRLEALRRFTEIMVESRGNPTKAEVAAFRAAGFDERHVLGIILAIAVKTLSNYTNHLFKPELDGPFAAYRV